MKYFLIGMLNMIYKNLDHILATFTAITYVIIVFILQTFVYWFSDGTYANTDGYDYFVYNIIASAVSVLLVPALYILTWGIWNLGLVLNKFVSNTTEEGQKLYLRRIETKNRKKAAEGSLSIFTK